MEDQGSSEKQAMNESQFMRYATGRMAILVAVTLAALWLFVTVLGFFDKPETTKNPYKAKHAARPAAHATAAAPLEQTGTQTPPAALPGTKAGDKKHAVAQESMAKLEHAASAQTAAQHNRHAATSPKPADQHAPQYSSYKPQLPA